MNAADKDQVKQLARQEKRRRTGLMDDWKAVLATPAGRRVFMHILDVLQPRINVWNRDPVSCAFNATRHDVASWMIEQIDEADPDAWLTMIQEQRVQLQQDRAERDALQQRKTPKTDTEE